MCEEHKEMRGLVRRERGKVREIYSETHSNAETESATGEAARTKLVCLFGWLVLSF